MSDCLIGKNRIPDREEKTHDWYVFSSLMLSTWIRRFTKENETANKIVEKWAKIINKSFLNNLYDHNAYIKGYEFVHGIKVNPKAGRLVDLVNFHPVSLLTNVLDKTIESTYFRYILEHDCGIYYVYGKKLKDAPETFQAKYTSNYLRAVELLAKYDNPECKKQLGCVVKWLKDNMKKNNEWDMGKESKDGIDFPLLDTWKSEKNRIKDCTYRIKKTLEMV
jgi:hypothetical protein